MTRKAFYVSNIPFHVVLLAPKLLWFSKLPLFFLHSFMRCGERGGRVKTFETSSCSEIKVKMQSLFFQIPLILEVNKCFCG